MEQNEILALRKAKGMNRTQCAQEMGMPYCTLRLLEGGFQHKMKPHTLNRIAKFAGMTPEEIAYEYAEWKSAA